MRILFCLGEHYRFRLGGAEVQAHLLCDEMIRRGHVVSYLCNGEESEGPDPIDGIDVYTVKRTAFGFRSLHYLNRKWIGRIVSESAPDVIYQRGDHHFMDIVSSIGWKRGIPVVTALSMERHARPPIVEYTPSIPIQILENHLIRKSYVRSSAIVAQTKHQHDEMLKNYGLDSVVIPIGHPLPESLPPKYPDPTFSWVANLKDLKRPSLFIETARTLMDTKYAFLMIGKPDFSFKGLQTDLPSNLKYLGELNLYRTNEIIARSWALINTSESEGFSNTFVQAWMRGTPVISMGSDPEGLLGSGLGFYEPKLQGVVKRVRQIGEDRELVRSIGEKAISIARSRFDIRKVSSSLETLFFSLMRK